VKSLPKHGSNIQSVDLNADGTVTISGAFTGMTGYTVKLLHIWLAQPEVNGSDGVGLATDALPKIDKTKANFPFKLTTKGANNGKFRRGPAVVSAIAVIAPVSPSKGRVSDVLQWSRSLTLSPHEGNHVKLTTF
jgi:hypothetical protein